MDSLTDRRVGKRRRGGPIAAGKRAFLDFIGISYESQMMEHARETTFPSLFMD